MEFIELSEKEYRKYWENHPLKSFLSSPEIGKLRKKNGWNVTYLGLKEDNNLVAATLLVSKKRHFNRLEFYAPRGFLLDFNDEKILSVFTKKIRDYIKKKKGYILRIDPYVLYQQRNLDGEVVEKGWNNKKSVQNLEKLGYKKVQIKDMEQVGWMFSLNLEGKTEKDILKEMKPNTRNTIRKASKIGTTIRELDYDELDKFQSIMEETGERKNFSIRKLDYYQDMYKLFHDKGEIKYVITELNLKEYIEKLKKEQKEKKNELDKLNDAKYNDGKRKAINNEIAAIEKRKKEAIEIRKKANKDVITLSGSMFIMIQPEIIYLSSGNYSEYMQFNSQYLIQWDMIKYGLENNFKKHNFYGIPANINLHPKDYGIYEFKRGFNGEVEELIGEYELPISIHYYIMKLIKKIRK